MENIEKEKLERQAKMEHDGFIKTTYVALVANFWAHNHQIDESHIRRKALLMARGMWDDLIAYRKENGL